MKSCCSTLRLTESHWRIVPSPLQEKICCLGRKVPVGLGTEKNLSPPQILPVPFIARVDRESSDFVSVFCQLFVAGHAVSVDYIDDGVLRSDPNLILGQSQHAVLHR